MGAARSTNGGNGTGGRKRRPAAHSAGGRARGRAAGEFSKKRGPRKVDPAALARRRGRLGNVPRDGRSELGEYFGIIVREEMESQGYTQCALADVANVSESEMSVLLNAKHSVRMDTAERVTDALGFELDVLLTRAKVRRKAAQQEEAARRPEAQMQEEAQRREAQLPAVRAAVFAALKSAKL